MQVEFIDSIQKFKEWVEPIIQKVKIVAIDCEGSPDLSKTGVLCVVQMCMWYHDGNKGAVYTFVIDALVEGLISMLRPMLESHEIVKVIHDGRRDAEALFYQHGISLSYVLDTQIAYKVILISDIINSCTILGKKPKEIDRVASEIFSYLVQFASDPKLVKQYLIPLDASICVRYICDIIVREFRPKEKNTMLLAQVLCDSATLSYINASPFDPNYSFPQFCAKVCQQVQENNEMCLSPGFIQSFNQSIAKVNMGNFKRLLKYIAIQQPSIGGASLPVFNNESMESFDHYERMLINHAVFTSYLYTNTSIISEESLFQQVQTIKSQNKKLKLDKITKYMQELIIRVAPKLGSHKINKMLNLIEHQGIKVQMPLSEAKIETKYEPIVQDINVEMSVALDFNPYRNLLNDISLIKLLSRYTGIDYSEKLGFRTEANEDPTYWKQRPLPNELIDIAAKDVINLIPIYESIRMLLSPLRFRDTKYLYLSDLILRKSELYVRSIRKYAYEDITDNNVSNFILSNEEFTIYEEILEKEFHVSDVNVFPDEKMVVINVKNGNMGKLIGRQGRNLHEYMLKYPFTDIFTIKGANSKLFIIGGEHNIESIIKSLPKSFSINITSIQCQKLMENVLPRIKRIRCFISVEDDKNKDHCTIKLVGSAEQIKSARKIIDKYLLDIPKQNQANAQRHKN